MNIEEKIKKFRIVEEAIRNFDDLEICKTAKNPVSGEGNPNAEIVFVGEAPGAEEDKLGRPFVVRAGKLLDKMIHILERKRSEVFITNIVKWRPPENRDPTPEEVEKSKKFLLAQIAIVQPKYIVTLGRFSMNVMLGTEEYKISKVHGTIFTHTESGISIYPVFHPAAALRNGEFMGALTEDFIQLGKLLKGDSSG